MTDSGLKAAKRELQRLEAELNEDPRFRRWQKWKEVVQEYERDESSRNPAEKNVSISMQVIQATVDFLTQKNSRATSSEIIDVIHDKEIAIGGKDELATVSAYLSSAAARKQIDNVKPKGYGLKEWGGRDHGDPPESSSTTGEPQQPVAADTEKAA